MTSLFKGAAQACNYSAGRPTYPAALYDLIVSRVNTEKDLCVDVGCGTGQASVALAPYFDQVIGIDPSESQLKEASKHPRLTYKHGAMDEVLPRLQENSVACVTSAQAVHWLDIPDFYKNVNRVLKPGGVVAVWTYGINALPDHPHIQQQIENLYENVLGDIYWDDRRKLVENCYRDIPLISDMYPLSFDKGERISLGIDIEQVFSGAQLVQYLRSWSGYNRYCQANNIKPGTKRDPVLAIEETASSASDITSIWPVTMLMCVKK